MKDGNFIMDKLEYNSHFHNLFKLVEYSFGIIIKMMN